MLKKIKKIQVSSEREGEGYSGRIAELITEEEYLEMMNGSTPTFPEQCEGGEAEEIRSRWIDPLDIPEQSLCTDINE